MTPEERQERARRAALGRWTDELPEAICGSPERPLRIGETAIQCYVLEDGTRVLTQADFLEALGRHRKANVRREEAGIPAILQGKAIAPYITDDILETARPIAFRTPSGNRASGYRAELLPVVCEVYLKARDAKALPRNQEHVAVQADILMRGLAQVGIIALVDEATGYQELRQKNALQSILEAFIDKELQPWIQTFPNAYYEELFRLRGLDFQRDSVKRPQYFGWITNDIVYRRLAPGVLEELRNVTPRDEAGRRRHKYFQRLTSNVGYPKLREHLGSVVTLMKISNSWQGFMDVLDRIHPRWNETMVLPWTLEEPDSGVGL
jgi:hypothetical protein